MKQPRIDNSTIIVHKSTAQDQHQDLVAHESRSRELSNAFLELIKIRITFFVGMSAIFGYVLASNDISTGMILPVLGIFLLSCGSAAMNHFQERETDALMHRTQNRPLPSGLLQPRSVLSIILILSAVGSLLILKFGDLTALVMSWLSFASYNAIYTPLKKITPFAVIPGSFVGSFPVMAGWAAAGGNIFDPKLIAVSAFFFIWQIPHFWLLMDIYSSDYERAGFPTLRMYFDEKTLAVMTFSWIAVLFLTSFFFITTAIVNNFPTQLAIVLLGIWLIAGTYRIIPKSGDKRTDRAVFMKINIYVLAITLVVMIDKVLSLPWRIF
jgi:protoheme IX farnesyltransferase